jgi:hypothetical protein
MNSKEAKQLLMDKLATYEARGYDPLLSIVEQRCDRFEVTGPSGVKYQVVIEVVWDDKPGQALRILGSIDNGGWRSFFPLGYGIMVEKPK